MVTERTYGMCSVTTLIPLLSVVFWYKDDSPRLAVMPAISKPLEKRIQQH